jgi:hypothetical protein
VNPAALRIREAIASETRRRDAEVARQEQERRQEAQRQQEEARQRQEEARRKEEETRLREVQVTKILKKARKTTADEDALELLNEALTLIPGDPRVQTLLVERRTAIENRRVEEQRQAEERAATVLRPPAPAAMRSRATPSQAVLGVIALVVLLGGIALWWRLSSAPEQQPDIAAAPNSSTPVNLPVPPAPTSPDASLLNALPPSAPPAASPPARQPQTTPTPPVTSPPSRSGAPTPSVVPPPSSPPAQPAPPVQPPPVVAPAPVPAPVVEPPPAPPATAPPPVVPPVVAPPVPAPVPPPVRSQPVVDDRAAIEQMFRGYEGAWASLDADSLRRVQHLSTADVARVRASMNDARQFQVTVQIRDVKLENDGRHATVTAGVRRMMIPKRDAKPTDISTTSTFSLEKRGDAWVIVALR